ncbi:MAG: peptidoglycan-binding protein [Cyanobacteriota bacterium]
MSLLFQQPSVAACDSTHSTRSLALWLGVAIASLFATASPSLAQSAGSPTPAGVLTQEQPIWLSQAATDDTLQLNDSSDAVAQLQTRLTQLGYYNGPISGTFGPLTQAAVIKFQEAQGLVADGIVGPATAAALARAGRPASASASQPSSLLQVGDAGPEVTALQQRLAMAGYYQGTIDGTFGPQTEAAVLAFQQARGLTVDGIAGPATLAALTNAPQAIAPASPASPASSPQGSAQPASPPPVTAAPPPVQPAPVEQPGLVTTAPPAVGASTNSPVVSVPPIAPTAPPIAATPPMSPNPTLPPPSASVLELQKRLSDRGLYQGPLDGVMDLATQQAIEQAQRNYGLSLGDWAP